MREVLYVIIDVSTVLVMTTGPLADAGEEERE